jgi:AcrR family transcriptional regulator
MKSILSKQQSRSEAAANLQTPVRMAGEERRLQIVRVAMRLFSQHGFRGTTTREIAHAASVSEAIIFRHFATKEELYAAILDYKACAGGIAEPRELVADAIKRKDDRAVFEGLARAMLEHNDQDKEFHRLLFYSALEGHELAKMFWERHVRDVYEFLGAYVYERQLDGALRDIDPRIIVRSFIGMIIHQGLSNQLWDPARRILDIDNERAAHEFTDVLLRGIVAKSSAKEMKEKRANSQVRSLTKKKQKK